MRQIDESGTDTGVGTITVVPRLRLIPNGTRVTGKRVILQATLMLSPVPVDGEYEGAMNLVNWPACVAELMAEGKDGWLAFVTASFSPTATDGACARPIEAKTVPLRLKVGGLSEAMRGRALGEAWRQSLVPDDVTDKAAAWEHLQQTLALLGRGARVKPGEGFTTDINAPVAPPELGDAGEIRPNQLEANGEKTCTAIIGTGLADASVLLQRMRAADCLDTLADGGAMTPRDPDGWPGPKPAGTTPDGDELVGDEEMDMAILKVARSVKLDIPPADPEGGPGPLKKALEQFESEIYEKLVASPISVTEPLTKFRSDYRARLDEARAVRMKEALAEAKSGRFRQLSEAMQVKEREKWRRVYNEAQNEIAPDVCTYAAVAPGDRTESDGAALAERAGQTEYGHWPSYGEEPVTVSDDAAELRRAQTHIGQAYFGIEGSAGLSRVFGLAFDVEAAFETGDVNGSPYGLVSAALGDDAPFAEAPGRRIHTRIKTRQPEGGAPDWGWPVTTAEVLIWASAGGGDVEIEARCVSQFDGVQVMGGVPGTLTDENGAPVGTCTVPRFDVATLDVATALEAERNWRDAVTATRQRSENDDTAAPELRDLLVVGPDYQSNGLTLLNRAAAGDAVRKLLALSRKAGDGDIGCAEVGGSPEDGWVIHDAEDITNGYRLLVGVPRTDGVEGPGEGAGVAFPTVWRSLMGRSTQFGTSGRYGNAVEKVLGLALGAPGLPDRVELEGAMQAIPTRDLPTGTAGEVETIVDETFGQWDGNPGGVTCARVKGNPPPVQDSNAFGRTLDLPKTGFRPPQLRFGRPYRFALQAVYSGGRGIPLDQLPVEDSAAGDVRARLYYPSRALAGGGCDGRATAVPYIRALRHARLGAPTVLLPSGHATRNLTPMGYDSTGKMIVRSLRDVDPRQEPRECTRLKPRVAQRLVLVPPLPQVAAARHLDGARGILDGVRSRIGPPEGALKNLRYDLASDSGFPVAETRTVLGIDDRRYLRGRVIAAGAGPDAFDTDAEQANAVYQPRSGRRATTYYPDPAGETLVLRLRRAGAETAACRPLKGTPMTVNLTDTPYPERRSVLLSLRAADLGERDPSGEPMQQHVMSDRNISRFSATRTGDLVHAGGADRAHEIAFHLRPGEQFELEMWLVPSAMRLARDFALIQNMALLKAAGSGTNGDPVAALRDCFDTETWPEKHWQQLRDTLQAIDKGAAKEGLRYIGPGGAIVPGHRVLLALGTAVRQAMLCHPVHELSALRRIELIHAVNRPDERPVARALPPGVDPFARAVATDPPPTTPDRSLPVEAARPATLAALPGERQRIAAGSKLAMLTGEVEVDLEQVDTVEILARCVSPDQAVFDDPGRGRSLAHRLAQTWPRALSGTQDDGDPSDLPYRRAHEIFGIEVARDGRVRLPEGDVTLLRIEDIAPPKRDAPADRLDLGLHFLDEDGKPDGSRDGPAIDRPGRPSVRHLFPDGKARRLRLTFNGLARTAEAMETAARELKARDPWVGTEGIAHEIGELLDARPLPRRLMENLSDPVEVILPASVRPAEPVVRRPSHAIERIRKVQEAQSGGRVVTIEQRGRTRLRFARGWFSSGVDERIGIVTWPPDQSALDAALTAENRVTLRPSRDRDDRVPNRLPGSCLGATLGDPAPPGPGREISLPDFEDDDLGPGGRFVTRRGMDPTCIPRELAAPQKRIFLSKESFPDLWRHPADPSLAEYVPQVAMPLGDVPQPAEVIGNGFGEAAGGGGEDNSGDGPVPVDFVPPLICGLITYAPLFDPEAEEWYCDVHLRPGKRANQMVRFGLVRYQPHTRPDLRCSRPASVFCTPLPDRTVAMAYDPDTRSIRVTVTGPISIGRVLEAFGRGNPDGDEARHEAIRERESNVLRISAVATGHAPLGGPTSETVAMKADRLLAETVGRLVETRADPSVIEVRPTDHTGWEALVPLDAIPPEHLAGLSLRIEEIDYRLASDLQETLGEPIDPATYAPSSDPAAHAKAGEALLASFRERNPGLDVTEPVATLLPSEVLAAAEAAGSAT